MEFSSKFMTPSKLFTTTKAFFVSFNIHWIRFVYHNRHSYFIWHMFVHRVRYRLGNGVRLRHWIRHLHRVPNRIGNFLLDGIRYRLGDVHWVGLWDMNWVRFINRNWIWNFNWIRNFLYHFVGNGVGHWYFNFFVYRDFLDVTAVFYAAFEAATTSAAAYEFMFFETTTTAIA